MKNPPYHIESVTYEDEVGCTILSQVFPGRQYAIFLKAGEKGQLSVHSLQAYSDIWKLELSLKKTKCVIFSKGNTNYSTLHPLYYKGKAIIYVPFFKYVGVEFSQNCEFKKVKSERLTKARNAIFSLRRILGTNGNVSPKLALSLFDYKILPALTYGSIIWSIEHSK